MFTGLWCVFGGVDRCFAYQKTTSKRTVDARHTRLPMKTKAAKLKPRKKVNRIREEFPRVRLVRRRNGSMVYRVDCRCNGWVGQATYEFQTRKEALEKARSIAEAVESRGAAQLFFCKSVKG